ncbi:hypothetical protein Poli38472_003483 [Pythium oligandrum]|uniref:subtilisin n=1 Tax=Pythium oligandrum TaxID=41045 RepID=A0A8K1C6Y1_PYTOL|nr:hypothetical protein Poli38472_003483 [Pythium oligandrum]|eukprot:TMW57558.1 hypothetical protein Poli38472_003483 [Pythium oligandrum]
MNLRLTLVAAAAVAATTVSVEAAPRVHHGVHRQLREQGKANIVVTMKTKPTEALASLESTSFASRGDKISHMVNKLETLASESQREIDALLSQESTVSLFEAEHKSWALNARLFKGASAELIDKLAGLADVAEIRMEEVYQLHDEPAKIVESTEANKIEWGVDRIGATKVWADGTFGAGVVVANIDTGVRYTHEIVKDSFRSDYNWYDPDFQTDKPYDNNGHGTHTMGTIAGAKGFGVAPGAKWIACLGCPSACPEFNLVKCGEFMTCPTDTKGQNKDCSKAPHVINNSWGGSGGRPYYQPVVDAWHQAGIIPVFSQGNSGPECGTAGSPGDYANVIGVGATASNETLARFSSKGPAKSGLLKPDISAPGRYILSSFNGSDTQYANISGTSMAAPHVTGAIALILSANSSLKYNDVRTLLTSTTDQATLLPTNYTCDNTPDTVWPNNQYGHGRLNVFNAYQGFRPSPAPTTPAPTTSAPTPAPTPAPSTPAPGFCAKIKTKGVCQFWFFCNWDSAVDSCLPRY